MAPSNTFEYFQDLRTFKIEMSALRELVLQCNLQETLKWKSPCYTHKNKNIVMLAVFKNYCALSFFKGTLLLDKNGVLTAPGPNSRHVKMWKFTHVNQIHQAAATIKAYVFEAIEIENQGLTVAAPTPTTEIPLELAQELKQNNHLHKAFYQLTPGKQRGYVLFFSGAKQSETRSKRVKKYIPRILAGKGIHDCVCGHSNKMPNCDGSHKNYPNSVTM